MTPTFITTGECKQVLSTNPATPTHVDHYEVGRKGMGTIWMLNAVPEYYVKGKSIYIDKYGTPWTKSK
jgi:hypothetical protein